MLNNNIFFQLLENVPADELGKNWELFQIIAFFFVDIAYDILLIINWFMFVITRKKLLF